MTTHHTTGNVIFSDAIWIATNKFYRRWLHKKKLLTSENDEVKERTVHRAPNRHEVHVFADTVQGELVQLGEGTHAKHEEPLLGSERRTGGR